MVGTLNLDRVWQVVALPRPGQTIIATQTERQFGGKGANQAVAAVRQGATVRLIGAVGDDDEGRGYRDHLRRAGIAVDHVAVIAGVPTGTAHVYVDVNGENLIVVDRGANARLSVAGLDAVLPVTDVMLIQLECALDAAVDALRRSERAGVRSVLNASPTASAFPWGQGAIDTVIVNEHECAESFGQSPAAMWALSESARGKFLQARQVRHLVITQGAAATLHLSAAECHCVPTFPVTPKDTVGAGDTFAGTLAARLAAGAGWAEALEHANVAAGLSTLALGAQAAMPTRAEVEAAIAQRK